MKWWLLGVLLLPSLASAHKPSDSYLTLRVMAERAVGRWDVALRDLDLALELDADGDGSLTGRELRRREAELGAYLLARLSLVADDGPCPLRATGHRVTEHSDGPYAVLDFEAGCGGAPRMLEVRYGLLFELDPQHRGLARIEGAGVGQTGIFLADRQALTFELQGGGAAPRAGALREMMAAGVHHIWIGVDHILFLLALLLPAVLRREGGRWIPAAGFLPVVKEVARIVTAFTVAHSVTLALSTLGVVQLPVRWVEVAIALSVALAAVNNLKPLFHARWGLAFALGLLHGFGFSNVLADLGLPRGTLLLHLVGFNLGVELGQLAIVAAFLPVSFLLRTRWVYRWPIFAGGSAAIVATALVWSVQRAWL